MPAIPPVDHSLSEQGIPDRFIRWVSQLRDVLQPVPLMIQADGDPNGVREAPRGTFYLKVDGTAGDRLYVKSTNTGNEGWELVG